MLFPGVLGSVVGGRLGYVLFYQPQAYMDDPLKFIRVREGGMSFHGGLLGVIASQWCSQSLAEDRSGRSWT
jgi:phosphatidylglycerol:prolipoprotein diacylglycerol transferase